MDPQDAIKLLNNVPRLESYGASDDIKAPVFKVTSVRMVVFAPRTNTVQWTEAHEGTLDARVYAYTDNMFSVKVSRTNPPGSSENSFPSATANYSVRPQNNWYLKRGTDNCVCADDREFEYRLEMDLV